MSAGAIAFHLCRVGIFAHPLLIAWDAYAQWSVFSDPQVKVAILSERRTTLFLLGILSFAVTGAMVLPATVLALRFLVCAPRFVGHYVTFLAVRVGASVVLGAAMLADTGGILLLDAGDFALDAARKIVAAVVWGAYLWRSEAVREYLAWG